MIGDYLNRRRSFSGEIRARRGSFDRTYVVTALFQRDLHHVAQAARRLEWRESWIARDRDAHGSKAKSFADAALGLTDQLGNVAFARDAMQLEGELLYATQALLKLPRQRCTQIVISFGRSRIESLTSLQ